MKKTFAELCKRYKLKAGFASLSELADAFAEKGYLYDFTLFSHWQKGNRIPNKRVILVSLIELFIQRDAIQSLYEANEFLESAGHGYLTDNERNRLFTDQVIGLSSTL